MKKSVFNLTVAEQEACRPRTKETWKAENKQSQRGFGVPVISRAFDEDV